MADKKKGLKGMALAMQTQLEKNQSFGQGVGMVFDDQGIGHPIETVDQLEQYVDSKSKHPKIRTAIY